MDEKPYRAEMHVIAREAQHLKNRLTGGTHVDVEPEWIMITLLARLAGIIPNQRPSDG